MVSTQTSGTMTTRNCTGFAQCAQLQSRNPPQRARRSGPVRQDGRAVPDGDLPPLTERPQRSNPPHVWRIKKTIVPKSRCSLPAFVRQGRTPCPAKQRFHHPQCCAGRVRPSQALRRSRLGGAGVSSVAGSSIAAARGYAWAIPEGHLIIKIASPPTA
jgi:hypothetical protein